MIKLDEKKLAGLKTGSQHLAETYGEKGTPSREEFEAKAKAWYYAELLRDGRITGTPGLPVPHLYGWA